MWGSRLREYVFCKRKYSRNRALALTQRTRRFSQRTQSESVPIQFSFYAFFLRALCVNLCALCVKIRQSVALRLRIKRVPKTVAASFLIFVLCVPDKQRQHQREDRGNHPEVSDGDEMVNRFSIDDGFMRVDQISANRLLQ